ncbi:hypothetical protein AVEN_180967-1 [Araneus ventricosus]|uniref:Uncharacterized protein n=1 Tax=Araneus ventricosus TaxID=182803 RepID=A0A4Y2FKG8_ARAVE|nr:hypothetical protein AVEN_180967-1 [Araneus ventricosus]
MLVDQIKKRSSTDFKEHFMDRWTTIISPTDMVGEIKCELDHIKTKAAGATNDPGRYVLGNKTAQLLYGKQFLNLEKINAIMTLSQAKRSSEEDRNKEAQMEQTEEMTHFEIDEEILPQGDEEYKEIKKLIEVNSKEFIESQHESRDLAPLLGEAKNENSSKRND